MKIKNILIAIMAVSLGASSAYAKPERLEIKHPGRKAKEQTAKAQIKNVRLQKIEDPEARKAIHEILNYLNLQSQ